MEFCSYDLRQMGRTQRRTEGRITTLPQSYAKGAVKYTQKNITEKMQKNKKPSKMIDK